MAPKETIEWALKYYHIDVDYNDFVADETKQKQLLYKIKIDIANRFTAIEQLLDDPDKMAFDILPLLNNLYLAWVAVEDLGGGETT